LLDLAPVDYFLFWWLKEELAGIVRNPESFKMIW
jgi:hypothetical protein